MVSDKCKSGQSALLCQRPEASLQGKGRDISDFSPEEVARLVHELQTRQIELEMQNVEIENLARFPSENPNPMLRIARDGTVRYANEASSDLLELWACRRGEALPKDWRRVVSDALDAGAAQLAEVECGAKVYAMTFAPMEDADLVNVYGLDVTERKRAEEALQQAHDKLEHRVEERTKELVNANARLQEESAERQQIEDRERQLQATLAHVDRLSTMGEMASGLAHELNQPLAAIVLQSEVVTRMVRDSGAGASPNLLTSVEFIAKQAHRAGELIRQMREFVKHTTPKQVVLAVAEVIDEVLLLAQRDLQELDVALDVKVGEPSVEIQADRVQMQQVLLNLIRNAIEAMETTERDQRHLRIEARTRGQLLEVAVQDTGCGIPADKAEYLDAIFGAFFSTKSQGMGLGLAISRSIVESHGGHIWATPNPDRGTTLTFTVPIASEGRENETKTSRICRR